MTEVKKDISKCSRGSWRDLEPRTTFLKENPYIPVLDRNENTDPDYRDHLSETLAAIPVECNLSYPDLDPLYYSLSQHFNIPVENLVITNGCDGAIKTAFELFIHKGDAVAMLHPTYRMAYTYADLFGAATLKIYSEESVERIVDYIQKTNPKMFYLVNPNNPTGRAFSLKEMRVIAEACKKTNTILFVDEAYYEFSNVSAVSLIDHYPVLVGRSFSKGWGLAGCRVGFLVSNEEFTSEALKVRPMMPISHFSMLAVQVAMKHYWYMHISLENLNIGRTWMAEYFENKGFEMFDTSKTNYVLVKLPEKFRNKLKTKCYFKTYTEGLVKDYSSITAMPIYDTKRLFEGL